MALETRQSLSPVSPPAEWDRGLLFGLPSQLLTLSSPFGKREGGRKETEKEHSPSDLRPSQRVSSGLSFTSGHMHYNRSLPSHRFPSFCFPPHTCFIDPSRHPSLPCRLQVPHLFLTVAFPSILSPETTLLPPPSCKALCLHPLPRPTLTLYPDPALPLRSLLHPTPPHRPVLMLSPQNVNALGQSSSLYPCSLTPALLCASPSLI